MAALRTLVVFHAHPDDEAIATGGTMARAAAAGHRVVLVLATRGEHGEVAEGTLAEGEALWERRVQETQVSGDLLGVSRVEFLGYTDSGMIGTPENEAPESFWRADVDEAAKRLALLLEEEEAAVLTVYDENGVYGHPDHIQVYRVGVRAAELAGTPKVYMATVDRDGIRELMAAAAAEGDDDLPGDLDAETMANLGVPAARITTRVDVVDYVEVKRAAMTAHASQIPADSWFLAMTDERFRAVFGEETFVLVGAPEGTVETDVFEGLG